MRTIEAPGVEIKEIDKSVYTPSMTGTRCYVMGYSQRGTHYEPMQFTSKAAWQNFYGDPSNEAEKYFYNACSEVLNQNGVLYSARLPYDNKAKDKMVGYKFNLSMAKKHIPTASEYVATTGWNSISHNKKFEQTALNYAFDTLLYREIDGDTSSLDLDTELRDFYGAVINKFGSHYGNTKDRYSVEYYRVDEEESKKISARVISYQEAKDYLAQYTDQGILGQYKYYTEESKCIVPDNGDYVVQPMYCKYVKETTISSGSVDDSISTSKKLQYCKNDICAVYNDQKWTPIVPTMEKYDDLKKNSDDLVSRRSTAKEANKKKITKIQNDLKSYVNPNEMSLENAQSRKTTLEDETDVVISSKNLYKGFEGVDAKDIVFKVPRNPFIGINNDGYSNEPMFNETVSTLYTDLDLADTIGELFSELWKPYLDKSLGQIMHDKYKTFEQFKDDWNAPRISSWNDMLMNYVKNAGVKYKDLIELYGEPKANVHAASKYYPIVDTDENLQTYLEITNSLTPVTCDLTAIDEYRTGESKVSANSFWIFDKTCGTLASMTEDDRKGKLRQTIGIFPVVTTAANALYAQQLIDVDYEYVYDFEPLSNTITKGITEDETDGNQLRTDTDISKQFSNLGRTEQELALSTVIETVSMEASQYFPSIQMNSQQTGLDTDHLKKIGVVVFKAYLDPSEGNKISFTPIESFVGSLDKDAIDPNTQTTQLIDKVINTNSDYIYFFSNCFVNDTQKKILQDTDLLVHPIDKTGMLGWYQDDTLKTVSLPSLYGGIDKCFTKVEDINERDIDVVCDAGLANIAQFLHSVYEGSGAHEYDLAASNNIGQPLIKKWTCNKATDVNAWKTVQMKYDNFCKNVRKDCMFIADGPRPLVLQGNQKIVRSSKPSNTIDANILPYVKYVTGLNTNYGAGYCDWFQITDEFTGDEMWCPPSIKAMGVYINTDVNFNYWDAPAGLNRGVIQALDCSFSPTIKQAGSIYQKNWNYAINYPNDGIVLEGQKTFQVKTSAFDRVNVRRLFLRLERQTYKVARYFVYEGNTAYTRRCLIDMLNPLFYAAKVGGGIYDYMIICDETNNTPTVIDNNELKVKIGIKPVKAAEFILIDFIALSTGGSFAEM